MNIVSMILLSILGFISMGVLVFVLMEFPGKTWDNDHLLYLKKSGIRSIINYSIVGIISLTLVVLVCICMNYLGNL